MADPGTDEALQRERAEAEKQRTKLLRLRNQVSARHLQAGDESERSAKQALKERLAWTSVPPEKIKLVPAEGRFVLASVQNVGAGTPKAALNTWLWALQSQDLQAYASLVSTPEERLAFDMSTNDFASGLNCVTNFAGVSALKLRSEEQHGEGQVRLRYDFEYESERSQNESGRGFLQLKKAGDEWKVNGAVWYPRAGPWPR